jgi:2'-5' RNA ligase
MRLFVGIELSDTIKALLTSLIDSVKPSAPSAKWVRPENAHLTLVFLGWVDDEKVPLIEDRLRAAAKGHRSFTLTLKGAGGFGTQKRPRVLWVGVEGETDQAAALHASLEAELTPLGFEPEKREFKMHLTLARSKTPKGDPALAKAIEKLRTPTLGEIRVEDIVLFRSELSPKGTRYSVVSRAALS